MDIEKWILDAATDNGATLAGIASMKALKMSASHTIYTKLGDYSGVGTVPGETVRQNNELFNWPDSAKSLLVIGLEHPKDKPELDWWDGAGTPGNRMMIDIIDRTRRQIEKSLNINTQKLHYYVEKGGVFLKDAAVLAGLGVIGKNNMVLTPSHGPRIRLRALLMDAEMRPTGPVAFDPCADCKAFCRSACPEKAMAEEAPIFTTIDYSENLPGRDGFYNREICNIRMEKDVSESLNRGVAKRSAIRYCRKCEFVCPAGRGRRAQ